MKTTPKFFIHSALDDWGLDAAEMRVLLHLTRRQGKKDYAWPSISSIVDVCGLHRRTVCRAIAMLEAMNLIIKETRRAASGGHFTSNSYIVNHDADTWVARDVAKRNLNVVGHSGTTDCAQPEQPRGIVEPRDRHNGTIAEGQKGTTAEGHNGTCKSIQGEEEQIEENPMKNINSMTPTPPEAAKPTGQTTARSVEIPDIGFPKNHSENRGLSVSPDDDPDSSAFFKTQLPYRRSTRRATPSVPPQVASPAPALPQSASAKPNSFDYSPILLKGVTPPENVLRDWRDLRAFVLDCLERAGGPSRINSLMQDQPVVERCIKALKFAPVDHPMDLRAPIEHYLNSPQGRTAEGRTVEGVLNGMGHHWN